VNSARRSNFTEARSGARWVASLRSLKRGLGDHWVGLDCDFDLGCFLEFYFLPMSIGQTVRNPSLAIKMICTLDRDLSLFCFAGIGVSMNNLFNFPCERRLNNKT
jgi:hypothetical protein